MKPDLTSRWRCLSVLMIVLIFSIPSVSFAQQPSDRSEAEVAVAADTPLVSPETKATAQQDAANDFRQPHQLKWFGAGVCLGGGITFIAAGIGEAMADSMYPDRYIHHVPGGEGCSSRVPIREQMDKYNRAMLLMTSAGCLVSIPVMGLASRVSSRPPLERFIGKSPEYVQAYTDAYTSKMRSLRRGMLLSGGAVSGGCILLGLLAIME